MKTTCIQTYTHTQTHKTILTDLQPRAKYETISLTVLLAGRRERWHMLGCSIFEIGRISSKNFKFKKECLILANKSY